MTANKSSTANKSPAYRCQKLKRGPGRAFVELGQTRHYLGAYGSVKSREKYHRLVAEWEANGRSLPVEPDEITVAELAARFWQHADGYYRKPTGEPTSGRENIRQALRPLQKLYGQTLAIQFGPRALKTVRTSLVKAGLSRPHVNKQVSLIKMAFKWATAEELIPPAIYQALQALAGLKRGRTEAREPDPVKPVPEAHVHAIGPFIARQVWALVELQEYTGARGGELVQMRPVDLDTRGKVWTFTVSDHKTAHHGHQRTIYLGPRAQEVVRPFLVDRPIDAFMFSPREAEAERHAQAPTHRRPDQAPSELKTARKLTDRYTSNSYRRAIERACDQAFPPPDHLARQRIAGKRGRERWESRAQWKTRLGPENWASLQQWQREHRWHPHQLRHSAATRIRAEFGLEAAQLMLGHAKANVTQLYAEINRGKAVEVAAKIG